jgi:hypothetical protein
LSLTISLLILVVASLKIFEKEGTVGPDAKTAFNVVIIVLSLALGLNFLEVFKDMAKVLRWRALATRSFTVREADLILGGESLTNVIRLLLESSKKPVRFVCALWYVTPGRSTHSKIGNLPYVSSSHVQQAVC